MKHDLYVRHHSRRAPARPSWLWLTLPLLLLACAGASFLLLHLFAGDWLDLKLESARVRIIELMPRAEHPDFVPTPLFVGSSTNPPSAVRVADVAAGTPTEAGAPPPLATAVPSDNNTTVVGQNGTVEPTRHPSPSPTSKPNTASVPLIPIQPAVELTGVVPEAQRFNNCGPTTLRMYLSFFGYTQDTQVQIANVLKPNTDDRNVSPQEIVAYAQSKGFHALLRVNGTIERMKQVLSNHLPIMIEEGYDPPRAHEGWMGHYLLVTGYDANGIMAQDSYNGPNQRVSWQDMDDHWRNFNRTYLLLYTDAQQPMVNAVVGDDMDDATMYAMAAQRAQDELNANPQDSFAAFNMGSSLLGLGEYDAAANAYDQARVLKLPWRMLWYQFGPYEAYYRVGRYQEIVALADATLKPTGDLEESYYYKGLALEKLGRTDQARTAFQTALKYNSNYHAAQQALAQAEQ